jgi:hypothetical protein
MHQNCHATEARVSIVTLGVQAVLVGMPRRLGVQAVSVLPLRHLPEHHLDHGPEHPPPSIPVAHGRFDTGLFRLPHTCLPVGVQLLPGGPFRGTDPRRAADLEGVSRETAALAEVAGQGTIPAMSVRCTSPERLWPRGGTTRSERV